MIIFGYTFYKDGTWHLLKYTYDMDAWKGGKVRGCFIDLKPKYISDIGLLEHEKTHVKQFWRSFGLYPFLYLFSKKKRLEYEVEAYKVQLLYALDIEMARNKFAEFLANPDFYHLDITKESAIQLLSPITL
jgi:hypothetical protein